MSLSKKDGGLPPDEVVQDDDEILADSERLVKTYHYPGANSMLRIALAPCSPFSVTPSLMQRTADLAERLDVRLHTHSWRTSGSCPTARAPSGVLRYSTSRKSDGAPIGHGWPTAFSPPTMR